MTVELHQPLECKILDMTLSGKLTADDYHSFIPLVEAAINQHGKVRMLVRLHDFHGWTAGALWEDVKFDVRHFADIERLALVGESRWENGMAVFCKPFTTAKVRYFDQSKSADATNWIHEGIVPPATAN